MSSTRRRRLRAQHEREILARGSSRRRDAVAHSAPAGSDLDRVARVLATSAFLLVLIVIAIVLAT
jgi:hypothetical protein